MREFVYGSVAQFNALDQELSAGKNYKFANRTMPDTCNPNAACLWFSKKDDVYYLYIDKDIETSSDYPDFISFLDKGEAKFICLDDMISFFHSLQPLFLSKPNDSSDRQDPKVTANDASDISVQISAHSSEIPDSNDRVVDKQKVLNITSKAEKKNVWPDDISEPLKKKIFGQDNAIDMLADKIVINMLRKEKRLLPIALLGPTATGKSETAKSLAEVMSEVYGTHYGYIEIAGSEFIGEHSVHRFFGAPPGYVGHGEATILEPVRKNPCHIIVINEIEKADEKMMVGLMEAIDTGKLGMADNSKPIDLRQCIMIFTSNIPIDMELYIESSNFERAEMCRDAFTKHCGRPEISGKIGNFLAFSPLSEEASIDIIVKFVREELDSYDLILARIDENLTADFLKHRTKYGARGIRDLVSDSLGKHLLRTHKLKKLKHKKVNLSGSIDNIEIYIA